MKPWLVQKNCKSDASTREDKADYIDLRRCTRLLLTLLAMTQRQVESLGSEAEIG